MTYINLLCHWNGKTTLDDFAKVFFSAIGISVFEERESGNYIEGRYFRGSNETMIFVIALSDEEDHRDLEYWVQVSSNHLDPEKLALEIDKIVTSKILPLGFSGARMTNFGRHNESRLDYAAIRLPDPN